MFWASANDNGCHFCHHCHRRTSQHQLNIKVDTNILFSALIQWIYVNLLIAASENICVRPPAHQAARIHWIHTAGGASSSISMVVVFARLFVLFVWSHNLWLTSQGFYQCYFCPTLACTTPIVFICRKDIPHNCKCNITYAWFWIQIVQKKIWNIFITSIHGLVYFHKNTKQVFEEFLKTKDAISLKQHQWLFLECIILIIIDDFKVKVISITCISFIQWCDGYFRALLFTTEFLVYVDGFK